ncbi:endonuclease/exonuclease/phosphatase family protein [Rubripirellula obstinata]|nr:endonuclease/exonuclease/phosphatase family protein [Rubripirellula obstinata]
MEHQPSPPGDAGRYPTEMKTLAILLTILAIQCSTVLAESFRIATYNLNWNNRHGDQVLDAISTAKPDLICFQETTLQSERFLREKLSVDFPHFISAGHAGKYAAERFAFASKTPLSNPKFTPPDAGLFGFYSTTISVGGTAIHVVNVHLSPVVLQRGDRITAVMNELSRTEAKHEIEIAAITGAIDVRRPTIVVGDFNSISTFVAPKTLTQHGMIDSFASIHDDADTQPTWSWPTRPLPISLRIDYIFHTPHFVTSESAIIQREGSDHYLLVSELQRVAPDGG